MTHSIESWVPIFPGFYSTVWEINTEIECELDYINEIREEHNLNRLPNTDLFDVDYEAYENSIALQFTKLISDELKRFGFVKNVIFENVTSPKEYNFSNDSIDCQYVMSKTNFIKMYRYILMHKDEFLVYLKNEYMSFSGFMSYYSPDFDVWKKEILSIKNIENNPHILGGIFEFVLRVEQENETNNIYESSYELDFYYEIEKIIHLNNYDEITKKQYCEECDELIDCDICQTCYNKDTVEKFNSVSILQIPTEQLEIPHASDPTFFAIVRELNFRNKTNEVTK